MYNWNCVGIRPDTIYLPDAHISPEKWAVVACDQFTSQGEYWQDTERMVSSSPSALRMVLPEYYFLNGNMPIDEIHAAMNRYLSDGTLIPAVKNGFVLVERTIAAGKRLGIMACLDLETYDFLPGANALTRPTEGTVTERIPPRLKIRQGAALEIPHVLMLLDDAKQTVIEPLYETKERFPLLYDFDTMQGGGHLRGWKIEEADACGLYEALVRLKDASDGFLYAVGDGNHSLATARTCWLETKANLSPDEWENCPARYALVEIENLHSPAQVFEPIHRIVSGGDAADIRKTMTDYFAERGASIVPAGSDESDFSLVVSDERIPFRIVHPFETLTIAALQHFLDGYTAGHPECEVDYIHGDDTLTALTNEPGSIGILLKPIPKSGFFQGIREGGVLPRKTFSMGHAHEKRYYMEARKIL